MSDNVSEKASKPKSITVDRQTTTQHDLGSQVEAQRHTDANETAQKPGFGIRMGRLRNQGTQ
ncbi:hypothetical protein KOR42_45210 [Thalassoglobus neptunius]|uniref:Uncharacterized protein n=1 Tax=Thalassoglobus neptunius TaxID=1938619 RepID=A0A5C5VZ78_9PLAN|nr:hypothetical protein [Thalassoglobus neptunius]TWT43061.1 hypothetical protein KOR42_45210 [Thalassoglobus neptunius]